MRFLLTNDDSHRSPLLQWIIEELARRGDLTVVVPAHEQSFKAKSMSAFGEILLAKTELSGRPAYTIEGTPADCVNVGIYHLSPERPHVVVSGINAGLNAGTAFMFSSGTIGACLEANIAGIPGIAFSQAFDRETMKHYVASYALPKEIEEHLGEQTPRLLRRVLDMFLSDPALLSGDTTWNVNFPFRAVSEDPVLCSLGHSRYGSAYQREGDVLRFALRDVRESEDPRSDAQQLRAGRVTMTPLRMFEFGRIEEGLS